MKAFRNAAHFLKVYWALKRNADPEKVAEKLGRPEKLELTDEQAEYVAILFCGYYQTAGNDARVIKDVEWISHDPQGVAKMFFAKWPRTDFRYFMAVSPDNQSLEFTNADPALDGVELIQAAMVKLGAIVYHEEHKDGPGWYYQLEHPMTKRMFALGADQGDIASKTAKQRLFA